MEDSKLNITMAPGTNELIIREGKALDPTKPAKGIKITGVLSAPFDFYSGREQAFSDALSEIHLLIRRDVGSLELHLNDNSHESEDVITGQLKPDGVLSQFLINTEKRWSFKEFSKFIQKMAFYFADKTAVTDLIKNLRNFEGKITVALEARNTNDGNSLQKIETTVESFAVNRMFKLNIPVYQGYPKETFSVEIGFEPKSTGVDLFLVSDELFALEINLREQIMTDEVAKFKDSPFSKVTIS